MSEIAETKPKLIEVFADRYSVDATKVLDTLKSTAFKGATITNQQMMALLIVANEYKLNPFTKEIYAFPDRGGIVPVVSVDGWNRIINSNPQMDGIEFEYSPETVEHKGKTCHAWIDCLIYRKDRSRPIKVREFFNEVVRNGGPWDSHPNRMHRHKTEIQCARIAFGFAGIYDPDEAERIIEAVPEVSNPEIRMYNNEQKEFFDQLIETENKTGMYLFLLDVGQGVEQALHHSFEHGTKGKYRAQVEALKSVGKKILDSYVDLVADGDSSVLHELDTAEVDYVLSQCPEDVEIGIRAEIANVED